MFAEILVSDVLEDGHTVTASKAGVERVSGETACAKRSLALSTSHNAFHIHISISVLLPI